MYNFLSLSNEIYMKINFITIHRCIEIQKENTGKQCVYLITSNEFARLIFLLKITPLDQWWLKFNFLNFLFKMYNRLFTKLHLRNIYPLKDIV